MSELHAAVKEGDGRVTVELGGDLDIASVPAFKRAVGEAESGSQPLIVLDMRPLEFIDSMGLHAVIMASERAKKSNRRFVIVRGPAAVQRVFELANLDRYFAFVAGPEVTEEKGGDE